MPGPRTLKAGGEGKTSGAGKGGRRLGRKPVSMLGLQWRFLREQAGEPVPHEQESPDGEDVLHVDIGGMTATAKLKAVNEAMPSLSLDTSPRSEDGAQGGAAAAFRAFGSRSNQSAAAAGVFASALGVGSGGGARGVGSAGDLANSWGTARDAGRITSFRLASGGSGVVSSAKAAEAEGIADSVVARAESFTVGDRTYTKSMGNGFRSARGSSPTGGRYGAPGVGVRERFSPPGVLTRHLNHATGSFGGGPSASGGSVPSRGSGAHGSAVQRAGSTAVRAAERPLSPEEATSAARQRMEDYGIVQVQSAKALEKQLFADKTQAPIIIWRSSAKVSLADDMPDALAVAQAESLAGAGGPSLGSPGRSVGGYGPPAVAPAKTVSPDKASEPPLPKLDSTFTYKPMVDRRPKPKYGAWYIPTEKWRVQWPGEPFVVDPTLEVSTFGQPAPKEARKYRRSSAKDAEIVEAKAAALAKEIPALPISKQLKSFIASNYDRVPHFLDNVQESGGDEGGGRHNRRSSTGAGRRASGGR